MEKDSIYSKEREKIPKGRIQFVGFDMDGTLLDSMHILQEVFEKNITREYGIPSESVSEYLRQSWGTPTEIQIKEMYYMYMGKELPAQNVQAMAVMVDKQFSMLPCEPFPDVNDTLELLCQSGYRLFVSSAHTTEAVSRRLYSSGLSQYFGFIAGKSSEQENYTKGEPHLRAAANSFSTPYDKLITSTVFIGDVRKDISTARAAGILAIGRVGTLSAEELLAEGAFMALEDFSALPTILPLLNPPIQL